MKPHAFDYLPCEDEIQALEALNQHGEDARILAGGQSLIAMLNMRLLEPAILLDINRIAGLQAIQWHGRDQAQTLLIPADATQSHVLALQALKDKVPLLHSALRQTGHVQTRNRGTVCGSLAHADPSAELPLAACVLNAQVHLQSRRGKRAMAARDFFTGLLQTAREADEMIMGVDFSLCDSATESFSFHDTAMRNGDFPIVSIGVHVQPGKITIGVGGGPAKPEVRDWPLLEGSALDDALNTLAWEMEMQDDVHASARYRRHLVRELGRTAIEEARKCLR